MDHFNTMTHILRYLQPLTLIAAAVLSLSCESKQELQDRMDAIAGEYARVYREALQ